MPMTNTENCNYGPLQKGNQEIRILTLLPGHWDAGICCRMNIHSLKENLGYETLSYVWGNEAATESIQVNDLEINVTQNLKSALLHLRKQDGPLKLWIDVLCINQSDTVEKSHQVQFMGNIYKNCSRVYIWLGSDLPGQVTTQARTQTTSNDPFALLRHFKNEDNHLSQLSCFVQNRNYNGYSFNRMEPTFKDAWEELCKVIQSPWWLRLWTVQEAILPTDAIMIFGHFRIESPTLHKTLSCSLMHWWSCCSAASRVLPPDISDTLHEFSRSIFSLELVRELTHRRDSFFDLCDLLQQYGHRQCKDPRDKIYGLLALTNRDRYPTLVPNYDCDNVTLFKTAAKAILEAGNGELSWLYGIGYNWQGDKLPSWVGKGLAKSSDIPLSDLRLNLLTLSKKFYGASKTLRADVIFSDDSELRLRGVRLDTLSRVGPHISRWLQEFVGKAIRGWLDIANLQKLVMERGSVPREEAEPFWRTMLGGIFVVDNKLPGPYNVRNYEYEDFEGFEEWLRWTLDGGEKPDLLVESSAWAAIYGRAFFSTDNSYTGLSYSKIEPGDEVLVLYGGCVPFILRPQLSKAPMAETHCYTFVGDCYLDGFMRGEGIDEFGTQAEDIVLI